MSYLRNRFIAQTKANRCKESIKHPVLILKEKETSGLWNRILILSGSKCSSFTHLRLIFQIIMQLLVPLLKIRCRIYLFDLCILTVNDIVNALLVPWIRYTCHQVILIFGGTWALLILMMLLLSSFGFWAGWEDLSLPLHILLNLCKWA